MKHLLNILSTWRITRILMEETGPYDVFKTLRDKALIEALAQHRHWIEIHEALQCKFCLSVWVGMMIAIATGQNILWGFAYSAGALWYDSAYEILRSKEDE